MKRSKQRKGPLPDYTGDRQAAERLADEIKRYWMRAGNFAIKVWVEKQVVHKQARYYIRSNLQWSVPK